MKLDDVPIAKNYLAPSKTIRRNRPMYRGRYVERAYCDRQYVEL